MALTDQLKNALEKLTSKQRMTLLGVLIGLLIGAFIYFAFIPMNNEIKALRKVIAEKQAVVKSNEERIRRLDELKARVVILKAQLEVMKEKLPAESEVSSLLRDIQTLVNKSGLTLKLWKPDKRKPHQSGLYEEIPITVNIIGGYHNFGIFLDQVARLPRIVNVLNLKMDGAKLESAGAVKINISCTAQTFAAMEKKVEATPGKAPGAPAGTPAPAPATR